MYVDSEDPVNFSTIPDLRNRRTIRLTIGDMTKRRKRRVTNTPATDKKFD